MRPPAEQLAEHFSRRVAPLPPRNSAPAAPAPAAAADGAPAPADPPTPAETPGQPVLAADFAAKGYHFDATIAPGQVVEAATVMDEEGFALDAITGVDWIAEQEFELVYDYFHPASGLRAVVRTRIPRGNPEIATICAVFGGANWHERETHDFFGIRFAGHPDLSPFLLPDDADYHPLLKDFQS